MKRATQDDHFRLIFDRIADAYVLLDKGGRCSSLNDKAAELFGRSPDELIGEPIWAQLPDAMRAPLSQACEQAIADQQAVSLEVFHPGLDRWFENHVLPSPDGVSVYLIDITARRRSEEVLHQQQRMLDDAEQMGRLGSWEWDIASNTVVWSAELYRIYGLQPQQHVPTFEAYLGLVHPDDRERVRAIIEQALAARGTFEFEERIVRPDRAIRTLYSKGRVHCDPRGTPTRMVGACQDVTERKRSERVAAGQHQILEEIAAQRPLHESLSHIAWLHEALHPGALCSVQLLDGSGTRVLHGAAPSLPDAYNAAIDGLQIGPGRGSCGAAAWSRERVIVEDIATHPYWDDFRALALAHGLRACWSTPILDNAGQVLGTFAVYYPEPRAPAGDELASIDRVVPLARVAIEGGRMLERLRERDRFFDLSVEISCIFNVETGKIVQGNRTFCSVTGFSEDDLTARHYLDFVHPEDRALAIGAVQTLQQAGGRVRNLAYRFLCRDGSYRWLEWESVAGSDGLCFAVATDITERRRVEAELAHVASHDVVTGLQHHLLVEGALAQILEDGVTAVSVLMIGLDRFQLVNESLGHLTADDVLRCVAARLKQALGGAGRIARFAGDEFVVMASHLAPAAVLQLAERLRQAVARPIEGADYRLVLSASVGISHAPEHGNDPRELLRRAEAAMRLGKQEGRDTVRAFSSGQMQGFEDRIQLGGHLRNAIRLRELQLHFQPQLDARTHGLTGFEALLRWTSQELGPVPPARFIPIAEALGLMPEVGAWVLDAACRQARAWLDLRRGDFTISVNVSAQELQRPGLVDHVRDALRLHAIPQGVLDIELTESALMENVSRVQHTLSELKALGTRLSLDDFGTGYSSLSYLKHFPIDKLKIDQSFVRGLPDDEDDAVIAQTIIAMGHQLRMVVAAEGVETQAQAEFLTALGCDELQGYLLGRPQVAHDAERCFARQPQVERI